MFELLRLLRTSLPNAIILLGDLVSGIKHSFFFELSTCLNTRWIGSVNALLVISVGLFVGRLYDRGHL